MPILKGNILLGKDDGDRILVGNENIIVGKEVVVSPFSLLDASSGNIDIGDRSIIEEGVMIRTRVVKTIRGKPDGSPDYDVVTGDVVIGSDVVIGANSVIDPNVVIKDGTNLAPNSWVWKD